MNLSIWSVNQALFFQVIRYAGERSTDESGFLAIFTLTDSEVCIFKGGKRVYAVFDGIQIFLSRTFWKNKGRLRPDFRIRVLAEQ